MVFEERSGRSAETKIVTITSWGYAIFRQNSYQFVDGRVEIVVGRGGIF